MTLNVDYVSDEYPIREPEMMVTVLRALRHDKAYTQQFVAERLGISQKTLSALERNADKATFKNLHRLLELLDAEVIIRKRL